MMLVFVGGHADGMKQDVPDNVERWDVVVKPNPRLTFEPLPPEVSEFQTETYKRVTWNAYEDGSGLLKQRQFMLLIDTPMIDAIDMILAGYHSKPKDTQCGA